MERYNHHFILNIDDCIGCTRCMRVCPTEAIRIVDGKVTLVDNQCVNCGACLNACHVQAFNIIGDQKEQLNNYKFNVAILPIAIYGMIQEIEDLNIIYETLYDLGFDAVFDSSVIYELMGEKIEKYLKTHPNNPSILTYCASVVHLIQLRYPALIQKLIPFDFPFEICAKLVRKIYMEKQNLKKEQIGVSYITECVANYAVIKQPIGKEKSNVDCVFLLSTIFKDILTHLPHNSQNSFKGTISSKGILWAKVGGLRRTTNLIDCLSVDGLDQVIRILEKVDLGQLQHLNVLDCCACVGGCVGGPFTLENPFVAKSKINRLVNQIKTDKVPKLFKSFNELINDEDWFFKGELESFNHSKLGEDFLSSLIKLQKINEIYSKLPKIDCCACGSPSCRALAEDVVNGFKQLNDCMVLNRVHRGD